MTPAAPAGGAAGMRCFLALLPDAGGLPVLRRTRAVLEPRIAGAPRSLRWVGPAALHLTLRFLGESSAPQVDRLQRALPTLPSALPAIPARRFSIWPNRGQPRLLVLELECVATLARLAAACEAHAREAGFKPDLRRFRAHITLARLRPGCALGILPPPPPAVTFGCIALMRSMIARSGATYAELARASLTRVA